MKFEYFEKRTGKTESRDSPCWTRSFNIEVLSLRSESDKEENWASKLLMVLTVAAYCWRVDSPVSVPLKIPPNRPPSPREALTRIRLLLLLLTSVHLHVWCPQLQLQDFFLLAITDFGEKHESEG